MSLWWIKREQLDRDQRRLIEQLPLRGNHLILGPPGSGKTNVLLRRAQYARGQGMPNSLVLTFTRSLTEFIKTGCYDDQKREIFPRSCISTLESWNRYLFKEHMVKLPERGDMDLTEWKATLARQAADFVKQSKLPRYDALFVDEAQDLLQEEVELLQAWSPVLFFVGDDRQKIYRHSGGLGAVRSIEGLNEEHLPFHYRLARPLCEMADRIQTAEGGASLAATSHYDGPQPGSVTPSGPNSKSQQISAAIVKIKQQLRAYSSLIRSGDRIGVFVPRQDDREEVLNAFEADDDLAGKAKIIRSKAAEGDRDYDPSFDDCPIAILTELGSKGLEFRATHWLFCDDNKYYKTSEIYYTVVTRAKTSLDMYYRADLPDVLARAYAPPAVPEW